MVNKKGRARYFLAPMEEIFSKSINPKKKKRKKRRGLGEIIQRISPREILSKFVRRL